MDIAIRSIPENLRKDPQDILSKPLGFGQTFADRMFRARFTPDKGWHDAEICAYEPFHLDPAALVFHYAQEIFEGLKAYSLPGGGVGMFRPEMNCNRFNDSARRLVMPEIPVEDQMQAMNMLVIELKDWVPTQPGYSLYIRPTMIGVTPVLGVRPSDEYIWYIICSPVAGYFDRGFAPVNVTTSQEYVRAAVGGIGAVKAGANYSASLMAAKVAKGKGFDQVVWLDANEHSYIEEMGGMNIFFVYGDTLVTSPLTGSILPGITRNSILTLAPELGYHVEERRLRATDVCDDIDSGKITEVFACGTAAVITAIGLFNHAGTDHKVADGEPGKVSKHLYEQLVGIQNGSVPDKHDWAFKVL